jgi:hypothetical protein
VKPLDLAKYHARLLSLPFVAVAPEGTAARKLEQLTLLGA